jgi:hypothetical protein
LKYIFDLNKSYFFTLGICLVSTIISAILSTARIRRI